MTAAWRRQPGQRTPGDLQPVPTLLNSEPSLRLSGSVGWRPAATVTEIIIVSFDKPVRPFKLRLQLKTFNSIFNFNILVFSTQQTRKYVAAENSASRLVGPSPAFQTSNSFGCKKTFNSIFNFNIIVFSTQQTSRSSRKYVAAENS